MPVCYTIPLQESLDPDKTLTIEAIAKKYGYSININSPTTVINPTPPTIDINNNDTLNVNKQTYTPPPSNNNNNISLNKKPMCLCHQYLNTKHVPKQNKIANMYKHNPFTEKKTNAYIA
jgi:hypothetical protein